jgi:ABC-type Zn2+ transport system substrate-binding protein/surface adhesin
VTGVPKVLEAPREHELDMLLVCATGNAQLPTLLILYKNNLEYLCKKIIQSSVVNSPQIQIIKLASVKHSRMVLSTRTHTQTHTHTQCHTHTHTHKHTHTHNK